MTDETTTTAGASTVDATAPTEVAGAPTSPDQATPSTAAPSAKPAAPTAQPKLEDNPDFQEWRSRADQQRDELARQANELRQQAKTANDRLEQQQLASMDDEQQAIYWRNKAIQQEQAALAEQTRYQTIQYWNGQASELFRNAKLDPRDPEVRKFFADQFAAEPSADAHSKLASRLVQYQSKLIDDARTEASAERKRGAVDALNEAGVTVTSSGSGAGATSDKTADIKRLKEDISTAKKKARHGGLSERDYARYMSRARALGLSSLPV